MDESRSAPAALPRLTSQGPDPLIGRVINDRYRIVGMIARGGMGKVYRAEQQPLGRLVALKVLNPSYTGDSDPEFHKRFFLEASIASKLTHPNTVTIFDYGKTDDDVYYIAMELLEGRTLHRALREEAPFHPERVMHIARQICRSLREAHGLGVIHRDLKPANVYLVQHGDEPDCVKVLDFGLVKNLDDKGEELTQTGLFMGSPKYMSPEQIRGERCDGRVDVYGLGVMMYEMLTGKVPFDRQNSVNILMAHIQEDVPAMSAINPQLRVPPALESAVRRCMAKQPDERFATMEELLVALKQIAGMTHTLSGEIRVSDFAEQSGSVELPLTPSVQVRGDLLSGGTPSITSVDSASFPTLTTTAPRFSFTSPPAANDGRAGSNWRANSPATFGAYPAWSTAPAEGRADATARSRRSLRAQRMPVLAGAIATVAVLGAVVVASGGSPASRQGPTVKAEQLERAAAVRSVPAAPLASPTPPASLSLQTSAEPRTVLVSLRSTPAGAMVSVEEREYGPTPTQVEWSGDEAAFGREVTFRFQRKGYRELTVTRQIRGDTLEIDAPPMDPLVFAAKRGERSSASEAEPKPAAPVTPLKAYKTEPY